MGEVPVPLLEEALALEDDDAMKLITGLLEAKSHLAPNLAQWMIPNLTFAPVSAITHNRHTGVVKNFDTNKGYGFIDCPEVKELFDSDVWLHHGQVGSFGNGSVVEFAVMLSKDNKPQGFCLTAGKGAAASAKGGTGAQGKGGGTSAKGKGGGVKRPRGGEPGPGYTGTIKQFSAEKGFGFIDCPELHEYYGRDTWLHHAQVFDFKPGETVEFTMSLNKDGNPQAVNLSYPKEPVQQFEQMFNQMAQWMGFGAGGQQGERYTGTIKSFSVEKGFGFIECKDLHKMYGRDTWVHHAQILSYAPGDIVEFTMSLNKDGNPQAGDLTDGSEAGQRAAKVGRIMDKASGKASSGSSGKGLLGSLLGKGKGAGSGKAESGDAPSWLQPADDERYAGVVKRFDADKGFGFIECDVLKNFYGRDTWVHSAQLGEFQVGDQVEFSMTLNQQGNPQAINLAAATA